MATISEHIPNAKIDDKERERRLKAAQERLNRMSESDPGGDIKL